MSLNYRKSSMWAGRGALFNFSLQERGLINIDKRGGLNSKGGGGGGLITNTKFPSNYKS